MSFAVACRRGSTHRITEVTRKPLIFDKERLEHPFCQAYPAILSSLPGILGHWSSVTPALRKLVEERVPEVLPESLSWKPLGRSLPWDSLRVTL